LGYLFRMEDTNHVGGRAIGFLITPPWRALVALLAFWGAYALCLTATGIPGVVPLAFLVTVLIAWDHGVVPSLAWVALVHLVAPVVPVLAGVGPFVLFANSREVLAIVLASSIVAELALVGLTVRLRVLHGQLNASKDALQGALAEVKELRGYLPICAWCKDIRDVSGTWEKLESYIGRHSRATFTHALCPRCLDAQTHGFPDQ
jgi:hypothetical protein